MKRSLMIKIVAALLTLTATPSAAETMTVKLCTGGDGEVAIDCREGTFEIRAEIDIESDTSCEIMVYGGEAPDINQAMSQALEEID